MEMPGEVRDDQPAIMRALVDRVEFLIRKGIVNVLEPFLLVDFFDADGEIEIIKEKQREFGGLGLFKGIPQVAHNFCLCRCRVEATLFAKYTISPVAFGFKYQLLSGKRVRTNELPTLVLASTPLNAKTSSTRHGCDGELVADALKLIDILQATPMLLA